jgi:putative tryptophan/tyrosine transport system substrate-binding protein
MASQYEDIITKQVQLLTEAVPKLSRLFVLRHTSSPPITANVSVAAAHRLGLTVELLNVSEVSEYEGAFRTARGAGGQAMHVLPNPAFDAHRRQLIDLAARYRLPAMYEFRQFVQDGGLVSYGVSLPEMYRSATSHVDRILRGARPGDVPMERPSKFELAINLRTAKMLGLTIPLSLLLRADQVIE